jgi:Uracil DNA glycosylase superfamily
MQDLSQRIARCSDCKKFRLYCRALKFQPKACIVFRAYDCIKFGRVRNLFIAEAPPSTEPRYFYNLGIQPGALKRGLFKQLGIADLAKEGLETFCEENFLTDTIKCRLNKRELGRVPVEIINNCTNLFLREEIEFVNPKNVILLGDTARRGLARFNEFGELNGLKVKRDCGKILNINGYRVILYVYPNYRNIGALKKHPLIELLS